MKLKLLIPLYAVAFILLFAFGVLEISVVSLDTEVRRQQTESTNDRIHTWQAAAELFLSLDQLASVEQMFATIASEPDHDTLILTNQFGQIIASTSYALVGKSYQETSLDIDEEIVRQINQSRSTQIEIPQEEWLVAISSVCGPVKGYSLRPSNCGFIYYRANLRHHYEAKRAILTKQAIRMALGGLICGALFWVFVTKRVTNRLTALQKEMLAFSKGDHTVRASNEGSDEIGLFAKELNKLFSTLTENESQLAQSEALRSAILDNTQFCVISTDTDGIITSFNRSAEYLLDYDRVDLINKQTPAVFHDPEEVVQYAEELSKELGEEIPPGFGVFVAKNRLGASADERDWTYISKRGTRIPVRLIVTSIYDTDFEVIGYLGVAEDITLKRQHEESLRLAEKVFRNAGEAIVITDENSKIIDVNPAYCEISGFSKEEMIGQDPSISSSGRHDKAFYQAMWHDILTKGSWTGEIWDRRKNGEIYPKHLTTTAVKNEAGKIINYVGTFRDVTGQKELEAKLENLAYFDPLTRLPNRTLFRDRLEQELKHALRHTNGSALMFIDLDRFKQVNDTLGHEAGDDLLIQVSDRLKASVREVDTVARLGGDEFTVVLSNIKDKAPAAAIAAQIIESLQKVFMLGDKEAYIGASVGISLFPQDAEDAVTLIKNADAAMYLAKDAGRGTYKFFSAEMDQANQTRLQIESQMRHALQNNEFQLFYQSKHNFTDNATAGYEALIRWESPELGFMSPDRFIPIAEENGMILEIGNWVLEEACRQMKEWNEQGMENTFVAVNLSAKQFADPNLISSIKKALKDNDLPPEQLEVEVTETAVMSDVEESVHIINKIKSLGVKVAMDDFGTGYSSLAYLQKFRFDTLKIDLSFIQGLEKDASAGVIVKTILSMAEGLGLATVAEGVETEFQRDFLRKLQCDLAQGYYYSKPVAPHNIDFAKDQD